MFYNTLGGVWYVGIHPRHPNFLECDVLQSRCIWNVTILMFGLFLEILKELFILPYYS